MIRVGIVKEIDPAKCKVRVTFKELDGMTSYWLPVIVNKSHKDKHYHLPDVGEMVAVAFFEESMGEGVVLGAIYNNIDTPPATTVDKHKVTFEDGSTVEYDRKEHKFYMDIKGEVTINVTGKTTIVSDGTIDIDGGSGDLSGAVTQMCICAFTGKPHSDYSANVKVSRG
jgi:phage baseplate assembly protein V